LSDWEGLKRTRADPPICTSWPLTG
jgi:hypothetical protein